MRPAIFWTIIAALVTMTGWSVATATYFAFHDDVLTRLIARDAAMQSAYEDRIAEMRVQVDRLTSRQLLDQEQFEQKLQQLLHRQAALESRAAALGAVADPVTTGSVKPPIRGNSASDPRASGSSRPSPINGTTIQGAPLKRDARIELRPALTASPRPALATTLGTIEGALARVQESLDRVETQQTSSLGAIEDSYEAKARRMRGVLADLGLDPGGATSQPGTGGPFVPLKARGETTGFERQVYRINLARAQVDHLTRVLAAVPVRVPVIGEIDPTSNFGVRVDPFLGRPAMHTGVDFRGNVGDPVRVTANGTITHAGWSGGYGEMVEVDHGNGMATRYGHLSAIDVAVGQTVKAGQVIGLLGSSGRSTGPHLHYETRVDGEAVDPDRFLRAGARLGDAT